MKLNKIILFLSVIVCLNIQAQFNEEPFFNRANSIYHNLSYSEIENFSVSVTSDYFEHNSGEGIDHDTYSPIEFTWIKPRQLHFNRINFPQNADSAQKANIFQLQNEMFQELRGIFMDWQRFIGGNLLFDMPEKYAVDSAGDTVHIVFESFENNEPVKMKFYFGRNAICFRIETIYQKIRQKIITYPSYVLVDGKWLCTEWVVKIMQNGVINSGFGVTFKSGRYKETWLPVQALIQVQTRQKLNQTFSRLYKFKNLEVNQKLNELQN